MTAQEILDGIKSAAPDDGRTILSYIGHVKEDGLLDALLGSMSGSDGTKLTKDQVAEIISTLEGYGYHDPSEKANELLKGAVALLRQNRPLEPEMEPVRQQAAEIAANPSGTAPSPRTINEAFNSYEKWTQEKNWFRYQIQHCMMCLNMNGTLASGTRAIIEKRIGRI